MKKVDFLICGTQKGGTTALYSYLREHPELCMSSCKEVHFFDNDDIFSEPIIDYDWYHSHFDDPSQAKIWGEATPIYMYWQNSPKRIRNYNLNIKIIILLRNPIERAYSHWNMERHRQQENLPFSEALTEEKRRFAQAFPKQHRVFSYVDRGFYTNQLRKLFEYFDSKNILILKSEYLKLSPTACLADICSFLGVSSFESIQPKSEHIIKYISKLSEHDFIYLKSIFENEIRDLEKLLGWDCEDWLTCPTFRCT